MARSTFLDVIGHAVSCGCKNDRYYSPRILWTKKRKFKRKKKDGRHNHNLWLPQSVSKQKKKKVLTQLRHNYDW